MHEFRDWSPVVTIGGVRDEFRLFDEQMPETPNNFQARGDGQSRPCGLRLAR